MAGKTAILAIKIYGDGADASQALNQVQRDVQQTDAVTKSSGKSMAGVWAGVGAAMLGVVKAGAAMESATYALNTVFEEQAAGMVEWANGMAEYGLSTAQAGAAAAVLGVSLKNAGLSTAQAAQATQWLVETSAELAAVMGGSASEAAAAMGAALRGEYDSLERFGIALTADAVAAEALALAEQGLTFTSEQQAKTVATLSLIYEQSTAILAGAEEGTVTMTMAADHLIASTQNLAGTIGMALSPALAGATDAIATTVDQITAQIASSEALQEISQLLGDVFLAIANILNPVLGEALSVVTNLLDVLWSIVGPILTPALEALERVLNAIAQALSVVIGWVNSAIEAFERFIDIVHEAIDSLTFWNDSYQASSPPTAMMARYRAAPAGYATAYGVAPYATRGGGVTINIQTGVGDPHAIAREIRKLLRLDAARMGRQSPVAA